MSKLKLPGAAGRFLSEHPQQAARLKELILYAAFGVLTTLINIFAYYACTRWLGMGYYTSTAVGWVLSVSFAFITNKLLVFSSRSMSPGLFFKELVLFFLSRAFSGVMDMALLFLGVDVLHLSDMPVKIAVNIIVIIVNYVLSKKLVFGKGAKK